MVSFGDALAFSFHKRSFIIGVGLFFLTFLLMISLGFILYKLGPEFSQSLTNMSAETASNIGYVLYVIKTLFFSVLSAYFFILAKKAVYNQSPRFSSEFFYKVLVVIFAIKLIVDLSLYGISNPALSWLGKSIITVATHPTFFEVAKMLGIILGSMILFIYVLMAFYMAYLMHFNFSDFLKKLKYTLSSPLTFLKIIGFFILFILLSMIPIIALYFVIGSFDAQAVVMAFASCIMGMNASMSLLFYVILMGTPIAIFCINTTGGRIFGSCVTLCYFTLYGILRLMGIPAFPISAILYLYVFFFILSLLYVTFGVIYPSFWIHLLAQGALEVNQKFDPSIRGAEEDRLIVETLQKEEEKKSPKPIVEENISSAEDSVGLLNVSPVNSFSDGNFGKEGNLKKIFIHVVIILLLIVGLCFYFMKKQPEVKLATYKNSGIKVKYLNGDALDFVQKYYPPRQKKLVIYLDDLQNAQSSIEQRFLNAISSAKNNGQWQEYYDFVPLFTPSGRTTREEGAKLVAQWNKFTNDICRYACIVDTQEKWVFEVKRPDLLEVSLEEFKK